MSKYTSTMLLIACILSFGFSFNLSDQPKQDGNKAMPEQTNRMQAETRSSVDQIVDSKMNSLSTRLGQLSEKTQKAQIDKNVSVKVPAIQKNDSLPSAAQNYQQDVASASSGFDMAKLQKINRMLNRNHGKAPDHYARMAGKVTNIVRVSGQLNEMNIDQISHLKRAIELQQTHQAILDKLQEAEEEGPGVTVVDEEEILRQQELRMMRNQS